MGSYVDELQKALNENAQKLKSCGFGPGTGERGLFITDPKTGKLKKVTKDSLKAKGVNAPAVHGDEALDGIESPITGEKFYSKSQLRKHYKANGYVETGGDHLTGKPPPRVKMDPKELRDDIEKSLMDLKYNRVPISEQERQLASEEERKWNNYKNRQK